jgi:hypothetical protein
MSKPAMVCAECQEPLAPGEEVLLSQEEMQVHVEPGKARVGFFKHKDPAACKRDPKQGT